MASNATTSISINVGGNNTGSIVVGDKARSTVVYSAERRAEALAALDRVSDAIQVDPVESRRAAPMFAGIRDELRKPEPDPRLLGSYIEKLADVVTIVQGAGAAFTAFTAFTALLPPF